MQATIKIRNLRLRTFIGFNSDEKSKKQDVVINAAIRHRVSDSALNDEVSGAIDYKIITKSIIKHVEDGRFLLLEKLVSDLIEICSKHPAVTYVEMTVDKPHALRFADSVSLTLEYDDTHHANSENTDEKFARPYRQAS